MSKRADNAKKGDRGWKISDEAWLDRFSKMRRFLEDNWGRIGLKLQRVRKPADVRTILKSVPGVKWFEPFRDQPVPREPKTAVKAATSQLEQDVRATLKSMAGVNSRESFRDRPVHAAKCLLEEGSKPVDYRELRRTQNAHEEAVANATRLWAQYHESQRNTREAMAAVEAASSPHESKAIARELEVESLVSNATQVETQRRAADEQQRALKKQRSSEEGWYARNEIVDFVRSRRYVVNPVNLAKAIAGLPEYSWTYSFRQCEDILGDSLSPSTVNYQLFELLKAIIKKIKPIKRKKIQMRLRDELLKRDPTDPVRAHFSPSWAYIEQSIASCVWQKRNELPYKLMAKIQDNLEGSKTRPEVELAKRKQLL